MPKGITYALGKDCILTIEGTRLDAVSDVTVRETPMEIEAAGYGNRTSSTLVIGRDVEIQVSVPDITVARWLRSFASGLGGVTNIIEVSVEGGLREFSDQPFTIHDVEADEMLDGAVIPKFVLRSWGGDTEE